MQILLLRDASDQSTDVDKYAACFAQHQMQCTSIPVLDFEFADLPSAQEMHQQWFNLNENNMSGFILTSPRAVSYFRSAVSAYLSLYPAPIIPIRCFVVGSNSAEMLRQMQPPGLLQILGEESGNAESLARLMDDDVTNKIDRPCRYLFLCGDRRRETLLNYFRGRSDVVIEQKLCYRTVLKCRQELSEAFRQFREQRHEDFVPLWVVYFSPSGVDAAFDVVSEVFKDSKIKVAAIGPTTASKLKQVGCENVVVSTKPSPSSLLDCICSSISIE
jgi:uroporphyrinogen-III synthase